MYGHYTRRIGSSLDIGCVEESLAWSAAYPSFGPDSGHGHIEEHIQLLWIAAAGHITDGAA